MQHEHPVSRAAVASLCLLLLLPLSGCGGGGSRPQSVHTSRSYVDATAGNHVALSIDATGRFTFAASGPGLTDDAGGQGSTSSDGRLSAQSQDGAIQLTGGPDGSGQGLTGTVRSNGAVLFTFDARLVPQARATQDPLSGSYQGSSGDASAWITIDPFASATAFVRTSAVRGGRLLTLGADGSLRSADGTWAGAITPSRAGLMLSVTQLDGTPVSLQIPLTRTTRARWTFLVFMNAANNLQPYGLLNMNQMERVGSSADINLVVQWKQASCRTCGTPEWIGTRRYLVGRDNDPSRVTSPVVEDLGRGIDMGDWRELRAFVVWAQQRYPADRYALVIWNHGAGWRPTRAGLRQFVPPRAVSIDDSTGSEIKVWELPQALDVTPRMDMVIFDASLMQMVEVAYEIRNLSPLMVGSEESPPGEGYVYNTFLSDLAADPSMTPVQFGRQIVQRTYESYGPGSNITQSVVDLSRMDALAQRVDNLATTLLGNIANSRDAMVSARQNAESYTFPDNKDLWHYCELLRTGSPSPAVQSAAAAVQAELGQAVLFSRHGSLNPNSHGLAIYVPSPNAYLPSYGNTAFARATAWDTWLQNQPP